LIIYIYGNDSFKKEVDVALKHSNIKFRLDDNSKIIVLKTLDELKNAIEDNPHNIYLIDDSKIIKKDTLNQKIKFLRPKDGIEEEYLLDNGIGDVCIDSIDKLSKHIIQKLEAMNFKKANNKQDLAIEEIHGQNDNHSNSMVQLDEELNELLSKSTKENNTKTDDIFNKVEFTNEAQSKETNEQLNIKNLNFDENLDNEKDTAKRDSQGRKMVNEFSEFDTLNEDDILVALNDSNNATISENLTKKAQLEPPNSSQIMPFNLESSAKDEITKLMTSLLNNKTLEVTIKVKE